MCQPKPSVTFCPQQPLSLSSSSSMAMLFVRRRGACRGHGPWTRTSLPARPVVSHFATHSPERTEEPLRLAARPEDGDTPGLFCGWPRTQSSTAACGRARGAVGNTCTSISAMKRRAASRSLPGPRMDPPNRGEEKEKHGGSRAPAGQRLADRRCLDRSCSAAAHGRTNGTGPVATDQTVTGPVDTLESPAWRSTGRFSVPCGCLAASWELGQPAP